MKTIEITVSPDGQTRLQTKGFAGSTCRDATRLLERALGEVSEERLTPEFHSSQVSPRQKTSHS